MNYKAILVDDEKHFCDYLSELLQSNFPEIEIAATARNAEDAFVAIQQHKPDVVFLDVEMPGMSGTELLAQFSKPEFEVVFTTSHDKYAFKAIKYQALDYLLKPVSKIELAKAIEKLKAKRQVASPTFAGAAKKIPIHSTEGITLIEITNIIRCEADNNYTTFYLLGGKKILTTKPIGELDDMLNKLGFFRSHKSHLINLQYLTRYVKTDGGYLEMADGSEVSLARGKKDELLAILGRDV